MDDRTPADKLLLHQVVCNGAILFWMVADSRFALWLALLVIAAASVVLGRSVPGWGFLGPVLIAFLWSLVLGAGIELPASEGGSGPDAVALPWTWVAFDVGASLAGVVVGAFWAMWSWTGDETA